MRALSNEEMRVLWRAYVALTLAHAAAQRCAGVAGHDPCLMTVLNNQGLALREMDGLLGRAFAAGVEEPVLPDAEEHYAVLVM